MTKLTALFLTSLVTVALSSEPVPFTINTKKWSHVLDDHFISITVNPTDLLQGRVYGLTMNSTMAILKGLGPAYVRIGSADTGKYTFKRNRYPSDVVKPDDEYTVTETHWMVFNEVAKQAGLDVIVCLNAAHRSEGTKKWDTRNSLELISFSDSQGYNLTWQLGYEVQGGDNLSGLQFGKDLNRLRTILNAFPRYQHSKLIGPDIRVIHKKEDIDFWNDVLVEAGPTLDAVTWHPRWPQPSKMKVSDNSDLGYEFPIDYLEWDRAQLSKILQKSIFKNPVWIGETKRESTGTFAEGLIWARRLVLAAKLGIEVVMKQPNLMDVTHPKPEYWIALLHKRLLGKYVLETRSVGNNTDLSVISHCTNPFYWSDKPEKLQDGAVTVYGVNMGALEQKIQIRGTWSGKSQLLFQYVLTSGSDPDSVFSQMTYLNGEPLMMTDDGMLPDIIPKIKKIERALTVKLPPYSVGFWVVPEAKVKICQLPQHSIPTINIETLTPSNVAKPKTLENIEDINQFLLEKLKNPESESEEVPEIKIETMSSESSEKDVSLPVKENNLPRVARRIRQVSPLDDIQQQLSTIMRETQQFLSDPEGAKPSDVKGKLPKASQTVEQRVQGFADGINQAIRSTNQEQEFNKFLEEAGLKQDFGSMLMSEGRFRENGDKGFQLYFHSQNPGGLLDNYDVKERLKRSISMSEEASQEESIEDEDESSFRQPVTFGKKITLVVKDEEEEKKQNQKQDLLIPHQPDLKGLEEKYKQIVHSKIQDGKRKIDDIKRKIKQDETDVTQKIKPTEAVNDIQEEIIKKEIELLEKTEEAVADILKNQKKRQETFEDIIFDELNDVKGERIRELKEMHRHMRNKENSIVKRQAQPPMSRPLLKTVEYIEKNFNLEPESVRKIKRSLEERMGEILRNYDTRKSLEVKKQRSVPLKEEKKVTARKATKESDRKSEQSDSRPKSEKRDVQEEVGIETKELPKERNFLRKTSSSQASRGGKKSGEEPAQRSRKSEEVKKKYVDDEEDSFEMFNAKKLEEPVKKTARRRIAEISGDKKTLKKSKSVQGVEDSVESDVKKERKAEKEEEEPEKSKTEKPTEEETKSAPVIEPTPLKNDKERREHMLQQITIMVDKMNSKERGGDSSRRTNDDEDISEEFDLDRRPRKIKRKPRKANLSEELLEKPEEKAGEEAHPTEPSVKAKPASKLEKLRKLRLRSNRKQKEPKKTENEEGEQTPQKKRHSISPLLELEKKKLIKPKLRKLNPKFHLHGNQLLTGEKPEEVKTEEIVKPAAEPEAFIPTITNPNEELKKDLEEILEEKIFLGPGSESSKEKSETSGKESPKPTETESTPEDPPLTTTEGFIIVEPTEDPEMAVIDDVTAEVKHEKNKNDGIEKAEVDIVTPEKESEIEKKNHIEMAAAEEGTPAKDDSHSAEDAPKGIDKSPEKRAAEETVAEDASKASYEDLEQSEAATARGEELPEVTLPKVGMDNSQRKRRATFLTKRDEEDEEDDYSSEERIQRFKQMVYRKSPSKKPVKNEVRSSSGMGMGADEFLRMAGSTVRVMFDDVIPEAYGQTKNKIQNMGITEYIKEFGKIVQQMKNLDQIFLNIGEAAVKGYIKGNRAEKGPYIQVISRKKREVTEKDTEGETVYETLSHENENVGQTEQIQATTEVSLTKPPEFERTTEGSSGYATTISAEESTAVGQRSDWEDARYAGALGGEHGQSVHEDDKTRSVENPDSAKTASVEKKEAKETPQEVPVVRSPNREESPAHPQSLREDDQPQKTDLHTKLGENALSKKVIAYVPEDLQEKIFSPWIKTTKDFIQQALTTLKRQRELSEILANDLMNRETTKRTIGKREVGEEEPRLPVYYMVPPKGNKKRETQEEHSDEGLVRRLRGLQPGVYVVPTEEMTNIRSEQITNEAQQKSGMPNVVTLNIYYDKKNADAVAKSDSTGQATASKIGEEPVTYYQTKTWNDAAGQYPQGNAYLTVPDVNMPSPVVPSVPVNPALQTQPVYSVEPRMAELPNSRLIQYPPTTYHYPPVQKMYPPAVANPQAVYGPVYYLPQESRYVQPPGTKRQWREFKARSAGIPLASGANSGWNLQYEIPASVRNSAKTAVPSSYNKNYKFLIQDKKRSVGDFKPDPTWSEMALPFWKFFSTSDKKNKKAESESAERPETPSAESGSAEDVFVENRKRAKAAAQNKIKSDSTEQVTEAKVPEEEPEEQKSRKKRSLPKLRKRSLPYAVDFRDHDILPEWFGTYQEIDNALDNFPPHTRRSHIISTPWSDEDEELLSILDADDALSLVDLDSDDYYYANDNAVHHSARRHPRSTDQFESNLIKTNMIYKMPMDGVHLKPKDLGMAGVKKLTDEDSSLELVTKSKPVGVKTEEPKGGEKRQEAREPGPAGADVAAVNLTQPSVNQSAVSVSHPQAFQNGTTVVVRNSHDDTFYYFFKYAYDSLVKVMKSMTELF